ncbi:MAG TPA: xanthine dehydrogenase family protein subunit M, partial [Rhodospirillales bacterium]|nr:xanthine dehydrogenase family protein subunit M [Rhodospirillales bacterium]
MTYSRPDSLSDALDLIARQHHQVVAGGTDIYAATTAPVLQGSVLDITAIQELRGISQTAEGWRIGGATTWTDIINEKLPAAFDGLKLCAREIGSRQIQNAATLAGNLCNASPAADGVPVLLTLEASVELCSQAATRTLPLADFLTGPRQTVLRDDELLSAIVVPETGARGRSGFIK